LDQFLEKEIAKVSFRSISTDTIQFLCNAYLRNQALNPIECENVSETCLLRFPVQNQSLFNRRK